MYAYCNNNPVMSIDPSGKWSGTAFAMGIAITLAAVTAVAVVALVIATAPVSAPAAAAGAAIALVATTAVTGVVMSAAIAYTKEPGETLTGEEAVDITVTSIDNGISVASSIMPDGTLKTVIDVLSNAKGALEDYIIPTIEDTVDVFNKEISWEQWIMNRSEDISKYFFDKVKDSYMEALG